MKQTAHITAYYWAKWLRSGGKIGPYGGAISGDVEWHNRYWLEAETN